MKTLLSILPYFCLIIVSKGQWTPDPSCPFPSYEPVRFPYPNNCSKYWECYEGTKYAQECPSGLEFNAALQECDTPAIAKCDKDNGRTTVGPTAPTSSWSPDPLCPYPSEEIVYFPYPEDCGKYYECWEGNKYVYTCPAGLWWHQEISECDYKENVNCVISTVKPTARPSTTTTVRPTPTPPNCPADTNETIFYNYEGDCSKYWECYAGHLTIMQCPSGLWWHEEISECDYKENVNC